MKKLVNKKSLGGLIFVIVLLITILYNSYTTIKFQKLELNNQQKQIKFVIEDNQMLTCDNERLYMILDSLPLGSPILDTLKLSSKYGWRRNPLGNGWGFHSGLDIYAAWRDTVYASGNGKINKAYWFGGYGRCVVIAHIGGYKSYYAHLYKIFVEEGDSIKKGEPIGRAGNSGAVTGPHLHYEIRRGEETTDPLEYIDIQYKVQLPENKDINKIK